MSKFIAQFENFKRCFMVLADGSEIQFQEFLKCVEAWHARTCHLESEVQHLQSQLMKRMEENNGLEMKLRNARHLLDVEKSKRIHIEKEKMLLEDQVEMVVALFSKGQINETKEKLQMLSVTIAKDGKYLRKSSPEPLPAVNEGPDTLVSASDMDFTEDDLDETNHHTLSHLQRSPKQQKRKSSPLRLLSPKKVSLHNIVNEPAAQPGLQLCPAVYIEPSTPQGHFFHDKINTPQTVIQNYRCSANGHNLTRTPTVSPFLRNYGSGSKVHARGHCFYAKTVFKAEPCQPCGKRIGFGKVSLKCRDCKATCHADCREKVPLPCVPVAVTPGNKNSLGYIADYAPSVSPMVPAVVVHCTIEIENRGLGETGLYRVPGAEKEVKELKEKFLRGKGIPNISHVDIHALCGTVKDFLRSLREPLLTYSLWNAFVSASEKKNQEDGNASMYQAISNLPQPNRDTLSWIICHLQKIMEIPECKMPASNLARVFGPTIVGYSHAEPNMETMLSEVPKQQMVMEALLGISGDYWSNFINCNEENVCPISRDVGTLLGNIPVPNARRQSFLMRTPLSSRDKRRVSYGAKK